MTMPVLNFPGVPGEWAFPLPPAQPVTVNKTAGQLLFAGSCAVMGYSLQNGGGASDVCALFDGHDASGQMIAQPRNGAAVSDTETMGASGVLCKNGLYMTQSAGTTSGAVWIIPL